MYVCFIDLSKASADRTLIWAVLTRFGVLQDMILLIRQFYNTIRGCMQLDDGGVLGLVRCGTRTSSRVRARILPIYYLFFVAFIDVAYTCFKAEKYILDALVHLRREPGAGGSNRRKASPDDVALGHALG